MNFNPIYWNTACLIVNSGSLEDNSEEEIVDIYAPEAQDLAEGVKFIDLPDKSAKIRRTAATDYGKVAKAIGDIQAAGIKVSLADINKSKFGFAPDVENNRILFGLKGMLNVGDDVVAAIIANRPYSSPKDFLNKVKPSKQAMISLIKGGAFDDMEDRKFTMAWYIWETCDKKSRITLQNMGGLIKHNLLPEKTPEQILARRVYEFNRYLKAITKADKYAYPNMYSLDERAIAFLHEIECDDIMETDNLAWFVKTKNWDAIYQKHMDVFRAWIASDKEAILNALNTEIFMQDWEKYAKVTISAWEMEVLCFYYHEHELAHINNDRYGFVDFYSLPEDPVIEKTFTKGGKDIHIFKLNRICGTCIAKNKTKSTVTILTTTGVVMSSLEKNISQCLINRFLNGNQMELRKLWRNLGSIVVI